ncbi:Kinesin-like protein KIN-14E [Acropora cervicornis]|uniref:Kinesin-like protein KIN-14E n=1 Tax=Acropora cervicornis TaxID=6130 RepID=A0AAD9V6S9_ACRCE|nr:Kinesin-like protein KIN-14E [Acropora cervicornis]
MHSLTDFTYTMIGDKELKSPGIAPRAMEAIYKLMEEQKSKFSFKVQVYMLELYVDRLIDLLAPAGKEVSFKVLSILSND